MKRESIILIGMAGAGKSTVGAVLAKKLGYTFTDLDINIKEKNLRSLQEIIDTQGEEILLQLEKDYMYHIELDHSVVSPGGSIIYHPDLMSYLKQRAVLVYLDTEFETIEKRIKNGEDRGIIGLNSHTIKEIFEERRPLYNKYADIVVQTTGKNPNELAEEIINSL